MCASSHQKCNRKKTPQSKSFKLSQNVAYSISFHMKKLTDVVIAAIISTGGPRKDTFVLENGYAFDARNQSN